MQTAKSLADDKLPVCRMSLLCRLLLGQLTANQLFAVCPNEKQTAKALADGKLVNSSSVPPLAKAGPRCLHGEMEAEGLFPRTPYISCQLGTTLRYYPKLGGD